LAKDYRELPKIRDSLSHLYLEHCRVEQDGKSISAYDLNGKTNIPCASLSLLLLGPGTSVTHEAIKTIAENGCMVQWVGEEGVRFYAHGTGETRKSARLLSQAAQYAYPEKRMDVARKMFCKRFPADVKTDNMSLEELKGYEGIRVRAAYVRASEEWGIEWSGRSYDRGKWAKTDPINKALSSANACLYGICHASIISIGCSPGIGFIHSGKNLSFVYDIADLYKTELSIPVSFQVTSESDKDVERRVRAQLRDAFKQKRLLKNIVKDIDEVLGLDSEKDCSSYDHDSALPGPLWDGAD